MLPAFTGSLKQVITNRFSPDLIYLFGSYAEDRVRPDSDIDLAFLSEPLFDDYVVFMVAQELADIAGRDVDLIQLQKASTVFCAQIVNIGELIYCRDRYKKDIFEMVTLKKYAKLNEERKPILDRIKKEGTIYGK